MNDWCHNYNVVPHFIIRFTVDYNIVILDFLSVCDLMDHNDIYDMSYRLPIIIQSKIKKPKIVDKIKIITFRKCLTKEILCWQNFECTIVSFF